MGSSASKAAKAAAKGASAEASSVRKYPTRAAKETTLPSSSSHIGPSNHPSPSASGARDQAIEQDASDPDLALNARLRKVGPVQPNPTYSHTSASSISPTPNTSPPSTPFQPSASNPAQRVYPSSVSQSAAGAAVGELRTNPAVSLLTARYRIAEEAEREFEMMGKRAFQGRRFVDVKTLSQALALRDEGGVEERDIEERFGLKRGVLGELGGRDVVGSVGYEERV